MFFKLSYWSTWWLSPSACLLPSTINNRQRIESALSYILYKLHEFVLILCQIHKLSDVLLSSITIVAVSQNGYTQTWNIFKQLSNRILYFSSHLKQWLITKSYFCLLPLANEVWGKVMFLHLSVILFMAECVCPIACWDTPAPPQGRHTHFWVDTLLGRHPPSFRYYRLWTTSGRYASYWNAFLFNIWTEKINIDILPTSYSNH